MAFILSLRQVYDQYGNADWSIGRHVYETVEHPNL